MQMTTDDKLVVEARIAKTVLTIVDDLRCRNDVGEPRLS